MLEFSLPSTPSVSELLNVVHMKAVSEDHYEFLFSPDPWVSPITIIDKVIHRYRMEFRTHFATGSTAAHCADGCHILHSLGPIIDG